MKKYRYFACCTEFKPDQVRFLNQMTESAREISYRTMQKHCQELGRWALDKGYKLFPSKGLTLKNDWHVAYYKSTYNGRPCYYLVWSAIEFIWVLEETDGNSETQSEGHGEEAKESPAQGTGENPNHLRCSRTVLDDWDGLRLAGVRS